MTNGLARIAAGACILALAACSSGSDDSARISALESDLAKARTDLGTAQTDLATARGDLATARGDLSEAQTDLETAQGDLETARTDLTTARTALSDQQAATEAAMHYHGLDSGRFISGFDLEETRAEDGSTLTIEFSGAREGRADIVLDRTDDTLPPLGDATGERFEGTSTPRTGVTANNVAVLYRTPLGEDGFLQYGWWQAEGSNSAGRTWIENFGQFVSARGNIAGVRDFTGMTGEATFVGHAAGIYAISNPAAGHNESGAFTADAMLTVDFDDASASGTIDGFVAGGEEKGWTVSLLSQGFDPDRGPAGLFSSPPRNGQAEVQWMISADRNTPGDSGANWWSASLIQNRADSETMGAVGNFNAHYTNIARMTGTFGAHKQ